MALQSNSLTTDPLRLKLVPIGNSMGIRLSRPLLVKYGIEHCIIAEQRPDGILLKGSNSGKATLDQTFTEMAAALEDWSGLDIAAAGGLDKLAC